MKKILFITLSLALFSCTEPTAETSFFSKEIKGLDKTYRTVDSNYQVFKLANIDTLVSIRESASNRYDSIRKVYESDFIDTTFEKIMLITRGQLVKKLRVVNKNSSSIEKEFAYSTEQYKALRENLIHEKLEKEASLIFYSEEKNALILLNAEIVNFNESINNTISLSETLFPQLDSIIEVHATKSE
jgi:hypothetical protein